MMVKKKVSISRVQTNHAEQIMTMCLVVLSKVQSL